MALLLCVDASVFVAACRRGESAYAASRAFLDALRGTDVPLIEPALLPVEVAAALARTGTDPNLALELAERILALPRLTVVPVDERLSHRAAAMAVRHRLRGADAIYTAVAVRYGARLVTLDGEQLRRAPSVVGACKPGAVLLR